MQQFVVPQFIEVEDKIFGPITTRQFIILLIAGIIIFLAYRFGDFAMFIATLVFVGGIAVIVAFVKVNGQSFHYFLLNIIQTVRKPGLRVWFKGYSKDELKYLLSLGKEEIAKEEVPVKKHSNKHIRDLSLIVNTGGYYQGDELL